MEQLLELFLKNGLKPMLFDQQMNEIEKEVTRSELIALIMLKLRGELTMSELASDLGTPLSTVTNIGQRLTRRGYIERKRNAEDQRVILVRLTSAGEQFANRLLAIMQSVIERVEEALSPEELQQFIALSLKVAKAVQTIRQPVQQEKTEWKRIEIDE